MELVKASGYTNIALKPHPVLRKLLGDRPKYQQMDSSIQATTTPSCLLSNHSFESIHLHAPKKMTLGFDKTGYQLLES
jgi:hypothetical protein